LNGDSALRLHFILAVLISLSVALTPARLTRPVMFGSAEAMASSHMDEAAAAMSDCEKMMAPAKSKPCGCCDTPSKAPCPDACLLKCGMHVLGVLLPSSETYVPVAEHHWLAKPEKPPDWTPRPPIPPPRV